MALIELSGRSAGYNGANVLRDISLRIEPGEKVSLIGKSGAGKSTLLRLLYRELQANIALVPQELGLVGSLSCFHNIFMGRLNRKSTLYNLANLVRPMRAEIDAVRAVAARLGLADKLFERAGELSGGQQQRTAVGRALYQGSEIFFGDEPVSSVDEHQSRRVLEAIVAAHGTVVLSMHDVELALEYSDRLIGLEHGEIVMDVPCESTTRAELGGLYRA